MSRIGPIAIALLAALAACRPQPVSVPEPAMTPKDPDLAPISYRGDSSWRRFARLDVHPAAPPAATVRPVARVAVTSAAMAPDVRAATAARDTTHADRRAHVGFRAITPQALRETPDAEELAAADGPGVMRAQILLDRANFSVGVLDGRDGQNTQKALYFFQQEHGIAPTGKLDSATYAALVQEAGDLPGVQQITVDEGLLRGPFVDIPRSVYADAKLPCMCYVNALEELDERYHTTAEVLRQLNPGVDLLHLQAGTRLWVPNVTAFDAASPRFPRASRRIASIHVSKSGEYVHALAADGSIIYHFPTTVGSEYNPSPSGKYHVLAVEWNPPYRYDPSLLKDGDSGRGDALLPPGPNSPVGIVWIALSKEHVGIHGTPRPDLLGLDNSHGCVRLANWDAAKLASAVEKGVGVDFLE